MSTVNGRVKIKISQREDTKMSSFCIKWMLHAKQTKTGGPYPRLRDFLFEVQVRLWRNEHFVTKWLLWLSKSLHPNVHKGIPKHHAKFGPNRISNIGDIDFYRKIGLVWFALVWFGSVWFFVVQNIKLCLEKWYVKFENNWLRNGWDMTQNVLLYLVKIVLYTNPHINISLSRSNVCVADIAWKVWHT